MSNPTKPIISITENVRIVEWSEGTVAIQAKDEFGGYFGTGVFVPSRDWNQVLVIANRINDNILNGHSPYADFG
jgi:hypothetical protein